ncbi:sensor histidine kinase/response regulator Fos-1/TcsA [Aspergillus clavatus NRRL 1]|uniref:histidine kinase n=1 Tax=Aspergillus clavatus (strain ATCC 1007 / CBS 513.65 / DSM 816 / NCTC 3887 / NRRL 1 / QM 1276 / 107) TaxID=344612 RepID=A1CTR5_ASPCL|nr:sensor histidine kinase/response regulator Fos-1 [Aspergillus clavatus NRRL 1]EAW06702.1 sensor histidine kinase/response regulator Fos-1 [Aspergillus clavatus NRRL 1]
MALDKQLLHLHIGDGQPAPINVSSIATPPDEEQLDMQTNRKDASCGNELDSMQDHQLSMNRIFRHTPVPTIVLDSSLRVIEVSDSHLTFSQRSRDFMLGASIYELPLSSIPAPDIATLNGALRVAITSRAVQVIDTIHMPRISSYFSLRITPIFDGASLLNLVLEAHNVTRTHTESLHNAYINETYKILVDTVRDYAIFMLDARGNIATWNSGAEIIKGYKAHDIIGRHFSVFYSSEDRLADKPGKELEVCLRDGRVEDEGWRYRKDGSRFWANVMITSIFQFGRHVGFVKVTRDLTERKAAEARMVAAFEESSKMKSDFLANMSHEIRTPMNGMHLALTMLTGTELNDPQREYASIIEDSMSILLQVINDVLDYSKLSSGSFSLNTDVLSVENISAAVMRNCKALNPAVKIISSMPPNFPKMLRGDPLRYRQVIQNLVGNAMKFTEQGTVNVNHSFAVDDAHSNLYTVTTEVVDTGIGVPEEAINTLFTPFTRFADSATKRYQGTGLGLSICKSLAELMDGTVGYKPNPNGKGSVFWLTAKMCGVDVPPAGKTYVPTTADDTYEPMDEVKQIAPHLHVLLVEDNMVNQIVMLKLLKSLGFERVDTAWDGAEAVRLVKQTPFSYNAILMDINMPVMNGLEATACIRDMNLDVPIIALTGNALKGDAETYLAKGMTDYIAKPVHRKHLVQLLWKWLGS